MNYCLHLWQFYRSRIWGNKTMRESSTVITQNFLENFGVTSRDIFVTHGNILITHDNNPVTHDIIFVTHGNSLATHGAVLCKSVKMIEKGKDLTEIFRFVNILCTKPRFLCSRKQNNL